MKISILYLLQQFGKICHLHIITNSIDIGKLQTFFGLKQKEIINFILFYSILFYSILII